MIEKTLGERIGSFQGFMQLGRLCCMQEQLKESTSGNG